MNKVIDEEQADMWFSRSQTWVVYYSSMCVCVCVCVCVFASSGVDKGVNKQLFRQILQGVQYIHSKNLLHRDLKVCNNSHVIECILCM